MRADEFRNPALAAWLPLIRRAKFQPSERVLVIGATGASGRLTVRATQLLGAGRVIAGGLDVVVDFVWGPVTEALTSVLVRPDLHAARSGELRLVEVGAIAGPTLALPGGALRGARPSILGSGSGNYPPPNGLEAVIADILARGAKGEIAVGTTTRPLSEVAEAWSAPDEGRRVVLTF